LGWRSHEAPSPFGPAPQLSNVLEAPTTEPGYACGPSCRLRCSRSVSIRTAASTRSHSRQSASDRQTWSSSDSHCVRRSGMSFRERSPFPLSISLISYSENVHAELHGYYVCGDFFGAGIGASGAAENASPGLRGPCGPLPPALRAGAPVVPLLAQAVDLMRSLRCSELSTGVPTAQQWEAAPGSPNLSEKDSGRASSWESAREM